MDMTQIDRMTALAKRLPPQIDPSRAWILGIIVNEDGTATGLGALSYANSTSCECPDDCAIDHENA
jgi:hypothetical protein